MNVHASSPAAPGNRAATRKRFGVFYTPEVVATYLVESTLNATDRQPGDLGLLKILDPACGDGALLWPAYRLLINRQRVSSGREKLQVVQRQLFGVDLDLAALEVLRQRFRDDLKGATDSAELEHVLQRNFICGNSIGGCGWESPSSLEPSPQFVKLDRDFDWSAQFPEVCTAGGFDVVIANPPYRRERGAKLDLDSLAQSPLFAAHRQARMDLWHYFFHRSLDLLRPGGILTFIVNSYWTTSRAGRTLVARLAAETTPLEFVQLGTAPVFAGVEGRHLTMRVRKGITTELCRVSVLDPDQQAKVLQTSAWQDLQSGALDLGRAELFANGRLNLQRAPDPTGGCLRPMVSPRRTLGELFDVRQGIAENPPRVTAKHAASNHELRAGEGVFVINAEELERLKLSTVETKLLRPYFTAAELTRYGAIPQPRQWLLYLTRQTAPDLSLLPAIERHLSRFRYLLEQRREVQQGKIAWWHLHWPREARLFEEPRILAVQMAQHPRFVFAETATYVGFSVNVIAARLNARDETEAPPSLEAVAVILNSKPVAAWFDTHAKRRGVNLDITGGTLKEFPVPDMSQQVQDELLRLGRQRQEIGSRAQVTEIDLLENQIDELVTAYWRT